MKKIYNLGKQGILETEQTEIMDQWEALGDEGRSKYFRERVLKIAEERRLKRLVEEKES